MGMAKHSAWRRAGDEAKALDSAVYRAVGASRSRLLDEVMPRLTRMADYSGIWIGIAAGLAASPSRRAKRAAVRGLATVAVSSLITNQVIKRFSDRERPPIDAIPPQRRAPRLPTSISFPSGHAASAAAFSAAVASELPGARWPLRSLARLVALSRVATGAHYPSDVIAGFVVGDLIAGALGRIVPPAVDPRPGLAPRPLEQVRPRPRGEGVVLVVNPASHSGQGRRVLRRVRRRLPEMEVVELRRRDDVAAVMAEAAAGAEVLAVAGGDGTVAAAAQAAIDHDRPLAVFPAGTFNHFAKDARANPPGATVTAIREGTLGRVDVGYLNDKLFLNTASVGSYSRFVAIRERWEPRLGKPLAAVHAALRTVRVGRTMRVRVEGITDQVSLLFIGNGRYLPGGFAPGFRDEMDDGLVELRTLNLAGHWSQLSVWASFLSGSMSRSRHYHELLAPEIEIELLDGPSRITRDGELGEKADRLRVRCARRALKVYRSAHVPSPLPVSPLAEA